MKSISTASRLGLAAAALAGVLALVEPMPAQAAHGGGRGHGGGFHGGGFHGGGFHGGFHGGGFGGGGFHHGFGHRFYGGYYPGYCGYGFYPYCY
jgi:hypothetical protein